MVAGSGPSRDGHVGRLRRDQGGSGHNPTPTVLLRLRPGPERVHPVMPPAHQPCGGLGGGGGKLYGWQRVGEGQVGRADT